MIEWAERGYGPIEGSVCANHVHDGFLAERITEIGTESCDYCGGPGAAALEDVMVYVKNSYRERANPTREEARSGECQMQDGWSASKWVLK